MTRRKEPRIPISHPVGVLLILMLAAMLVSMLGACSPGVTRTGAVYDTEGRVLVSPRPAPNPNR